MNRGLAGMSSPARQPVVANAVCYMDDTQGSSQFHRVDERGRRELYLNCSIVSLRSALMHNPGIDAALVVNFDVPASRRREIESFGIAIHKLDFVTFRMPDAFPWSGAYFKLEALAYLLELYQHVTLIDCDTFTVGSYQDMHRESAEHILLYDIQHRLSHEHRRHVIENHRLLCGESVSLVHYGGEIVAGPAALLKRFVAVCAEVASVLRQRSSLITHDMGDEQIISVAAHRMPRSVRSANAYLFRYWTGRDFRLLSTNYLFNAVDIWHLPAEKQNGLQALYRYLIRHGNFPTRDMCVRITGLDRPNAGRIAEQQRRIKNDFTPTSGGFGRSVRRLVEVVLRQT